MAAAKKKPAKKSSRTGQSARLHKRPDSERATVMTMILTGQSVTYISEALGIPLQTVWRWKQEFPKWAAEFSEEEKGRITLLVLRNLSSTFVTLDRIQDAVDKEFIQRQTAEGLGVLYGVLSDKAVRILEAMQAAGAAPADDQGGTAEGSH